MSALHPAIYAELRVVANELEAIGWRRRAARIRALLDRGVPDERPFPVQHSGEVRAIPWGLAELLHPAYGHDQTLERLAERSGFGRGELGMLAVGMYGDGRRITRGFQRSFPLLDLYASAVRVDGEQDDG